MPKGSKIKDFFINYQNSNKQSSTPSNLRSDNGIKNAALSLR